MKLRLFIQKNKLLSLVILLGGSIALLTVVPSGSRYCYQGICGIYFWGAHEIDAIWHLTLMNNAFTSIPFVNPIYSGASLSGYNLLLDLMLSIPVRLGLPADFLYFKILPFTWVALFVFVVLNLTHALKKDYIYKVFLFFFFFFGSTFIYMFDLYHKKTLFGLDSFGAALNLINFQYAFSLVVLLTLMYILQKMKSSQQRDILVGLLMFLNTGLKFYAGFITGIFILTFYGIDFVKNRNIGKTLRGLTILIVSSVLAITLLYDPLTAFGNKESILSFDPFAHSKTIIEDPSRFYLPNIVLARYTLLQSGIGPRLIAIEAFSVVLYLFFNFGTRIISLITITKKAVSRKMSQLDASILVSMIAGILMVLFFVQRGQWWNTVQFFYYSLFLSSFFAADFMSMLLKKRTVQRYVIAVMIVLLTLPFNLSVVLDFSRISRASSYITDGEMKALHFLKSQPTGVVASTKPPRSKSYYSHMYEKDTAYISAYAHKNSYIESEVFLQLLGIDYLKRKQEVESMNPSLLKNIDYLYVHKVVALKKPHASLEEIFNNEEVIIYKVNH